MVAAPKYDHAKDTQFMEVYKDIHGNRWYSRTNVLTLSAIRGIAAERANRFLGLKISEHEMKLLLDALTEASKQGDIMKCFAIMQELKYRVEFITEENCVLELANIYYYLQHENPNVIEEDFAVKKRKIFSEDINCKGFFLRLGLRLTNKLASTPEEDLLKFMQNTKEIAERIYQYIPKPM